MDLHDTETVIDNISGLLGEYTSSPFFIMEEIDYRDFLKEKEPKNNDHGCLLVILFNIILITFGLYFPWVLLIVLVITLIWIFATK